jgi:hypothetical protein
MGGDQAGAGDLPHTEFATDCTTASPQLEA